MCENQLKVCVLCLSRGASQLNMYYRVFTELRRKENVFFWQKIFFLRAKYQINFQNYTFIKIKRYLRKSKNSDRKNIFIFYTKILLWQFMHLRIPSKSFFHIIFFIKGLFCTMLFLRCCGLLCKKAFIPIICFHFIDICRFSSMYGFEI